MEEECFATEAHNDLKHLMNNLDKGVANRYIGQKIIL
jgi:hypothetical protein